MNKIDWLDVFDIAIELNEKYPEICLLYTSPSPRD